MEVRDHIRQLMSSRKQSFDVANTDLSRPSVKRSSRKAIETGFNRPMHVPHVMSNLGGNITHQPINHSIPDANQNPITVAPQPSDASDFDEVFVVHEQPSTKIRNASSDAIQRREQVVDSALRRADELMALLESQTEKVPLVANADNGLYSITIPPSKPSLFTSPNGRTRPLSVRTPNSTVTASLIATDQIPSSSVASIASPGIPRSAPAKFTVVAADSDPVIVSAPVVVPASSLLRTSLSGLNFANFTAPPLSQHTTAAPLPSNGVDVNHSSNTGIAFNTNGWLNSSHSGTNSILSSKSLPTRLAYSPAPFSTTPGPSVMSTPFGTSLTSSAPSVRTPMSVTASHESLKSILNYLDEVESEPIVTGSGTMAPIIVLQSTAASVSSPSVRDLLEYERNNAHGSTQTKIAEEIMKPKNVVVKGHGKPVSSGKSSGPAGNSEVGLDSVSRLNPASQSISSPLVRSLSLTGTTPVVIGNVPTTSTSSGGVVSMFDEIKSKMSSLKRQLEQQQQECQTLSKAAELDKQQRQALLAEHSSEMQRTVRDERQRAEAQLQRNLEFVDRLIKDKEELSRKCESFAGELSAVDAKLERKLKELSEQNARELKREREQWQASEKIRREQWQQKESRSVLERTRKQLEPEIQRLIDGNREALRRVETEKQESLQKQREQTVLAMQNELQICREQILKEKDEAVSRERESSSQRVRDQLDRQEQSATSARQRFVAELDQERQRSQLEQQTIQKTTAIELDQLKLQHAQQLQQQQALLVEAVAEQQRRGEVAVQAAREQWRIERETWLAQMRQKMDRELRGREIELHQKVRGERDDELEVVLGKMQQEHQVELNTLQKRIQGEADTDRRRREDEIRVLKEHEAEWLQKFNSAKTSLSESTDRLARAETRLAQGALQLDERHGRITQLEQLTVRLETTARASDVAAAQARDREQVQMARLAQQYEQQLALERKTAVSAACDAEQQRIDEIGALETRMRAAFSRKDEQLAAIRDQLEAKQARIVEIETLMQRQHNELFS